MVLDKNINPLFTGPEVNSEIARNDNSWENIRLIPNTDTNNTVIQKNPGRKKSILLSEI